MHCGLVYQAAQVCTGPPVSLSLPEAIDNGCLCTREAAYKWLLQANLKTDVHCLTKFAVLLD